MSFFKKMNPKLKCKEVAKKLKSINEPKCKWVMISSKKKKIEAVNNYINYYLSHVLAVSVVILNR